MSGERRYLKLRALPRHANCPGCAGYAPGRRGAEYCIIRRCDLRGHSSQDCAQRMATAPEGADGE